MKAVLTATVLAFAPLSAFAFCAGHEVTAQSCAAGFQWDSETSACVEIVSS